MSRKLSFQLLTDDEKQTYAKRANALRLAAKNKGEEEAEKYLKKATHPKGIIFPVSMATHLARSLYHRGRSLVDEVSGDNLKRAERAQDAWRSFFKEMVRKYDCDDVEWDSFPNPPQRYQWLLKYPFD
jgi:hypothetical protein